MKLVSLQHKSSSVARRSPRWWCAAFPHSAGRAIVVAEVGAAAPSASAAKVTIPVRQEPVIILADPVLLAEDRLLVVNAGPLLDADTTGELLEPFRRRMYPRLNSPGNGSGLGLSIVAAIATVHDVATHVAAQHKRRTYRRDSPGSR